MKYCLLVLFALKLAVSAAQVRAEAPHFIFADPFEVAAPDAFRVTSLFLRDPHVFLNFGDFFGGCRDMTDNPHTVPIFGTIPAINAQINEAISADSNGDGLYDLSSVFLFRPLDQDGGVRRMDSLQADCLASDIEPGCSPSVDAEVSIRNYATLNAQQCLAALPGTTRPYSPAVPEIDGYCYTSSAAQQTVDVGDFSLPLQAARSAGQWIGEDEVSVGLLRGFLREVDADAIPLPADLPLVGGQPLSVLLPGGANNCAQHSDKDSFEGEPGWWVYLEFTAARVPFVFAID